MTQSPNSYEVGYGKTPVASRFKAGQSGNPAGRPKGSQNLRTILREELERKIDVVVGGRPRRMSKGRVMVVKHVDLAIGGNDRAFATVVKIDGTAFGFEEAAPSSAGPRSEIPSQDYSDMLAELVARRTQEGDDGARPE